MVQTKQWKWDMRFGTWNVRSLYRSGSLVTVAKELATYTFGLLGGKKGHCKSRGLFFSSDTMLCSYERLLV